MESIILLLAVAGGALLIMAAVTALAGRASLNGIKARTVGDGQYGTARWATDREIKTTYAHVPFRAAAWRTGKDRPTAQGLILGSVGTGKNLTALVDSDDVHCLMIGASGVGKTAFFLYSNLEYACASGRSFLALDTKGDLARNYGAIARELRLSRSTVQRALNDLYESGFLEKQNRHRQNGSLTSNLFTVK